MVIKNKRGDQLTNYLIAFVIGGLVILVVWLTIYKGGNTVNSLISNADLENSGVIAGCQTMLVGGEQQFCNLYKPVFVDRVEKGRVTCYYISEIKKISANLTMSKDYNCSKYYSNWQDTAASECTAVANANTLKGVKRWSMTINDISCTQDGFGVIELNQFVKDCTAASGKTTGVCAAPKLQGKSIYNDTSDQVVYCC